MDKTWMPITAGILNIIAGSISLLGVIFVGIFASFVLYSPDWYFYDSGELYLPAAAIWIAIIPYIIICVVAIVGGVFALRRRLWGLALAGAICSVLTLWAWWLGVAAIVFLAISKKEFDTVTPVSPLPPPT